MSLMPTDAPDYMAAAWLGCVSWAASNTDILQAFRDETGNRWVPPRSGLEAMIDAATGADWQFIKSFIEWVNVNVWGPIDGPQESV